MKTIDIFLKHDHDRSGIIVPDGMHICSFEAEKPEMQAECGYYQTGKCMTCKCCLWSKKLDKCCLLG